jgi:hypothetical protein
MGSWKAGLSWSGVSVRRCPSKFSIFSSVITPLSAHHP